MSCLFQHHRNRKIHNLLQVHKDLQEVIEFHHEPQKATEFPQEVLLIYIANRIASLPYSEYTENDWKEMFSAEVLVKAGLDHAELETAVLTALDEEDSVRQLLFG